MLRILIVLLTPAVGLAAGGVLDGGPLFGGPRAFAYVGLPNYPRGQEVLLEIHATSDLPGAEKVFLGQSKTVVGAPGGKFIDSVPVATLISDPLPDTRREWKIQYWYSPRTGSPGGSTPNEWTRLRNPPPRKK